ncbi:MAG TPA: hypothetical protein VNW90_10695 [Acetobacteraceae bacterium]|jgi:hypothetical protein|nr:hypothetical protein [Acetobacteraceae bacterium]
MIRIVLALLLALAAPALAQGPNFNTPAAGPNSVAVLQQGPWTLTPPDADVGGDQTYTAAFTTGGQTLTFATTGFGSIEITPDFSSGVGTLTYQEGPTNTGPWTTTRCLTDNANANISLSASVLSSTASSAVTCSVQALYFRINANPVTSGTINVTAVGRFVPKQTTIHSLKSPSSNVRIMSAAGTNATPVSGTPAFIYGVFACNTNAAARYVHLYNTNGTPTAGAGTPIFTVAVPALAAGSSPCTQFTLDRGVFVGQGIGITITTGFADADATATGANEVAVNVLFGTSP